MIYILDANVLVDSNRDFYPINRVPEFCEWLLHCADSNIIKIPDEILIDIKKGNDQLTDWVKKKEVETVLRFATKLDGKLLQQVYDEGYAKDLTDVEIETIGSDACLISYALTDKENITVVTTESSKPTKKRSNKHIPDVCNQLGVEHCSAFEMFKVLDFRTSWNKATT
jgi:ribosomal protein S8